MPTRGLHFVYDPNWPDIGSTVMRGRQLSQIGSAAFGRQRTVSYSPLGSNFRRADLFLTKNAALALSAEAAAELATKGNRLYVDIVDSAPPVWAAESAHVIVTASITSYIRVARQWPTLDVVLINHHVDPRVTPSAPPDSYRAGYFGELFNAVRTPDIESLVDFVSVTTASQQPEWIERLPGYSLHYAVRQRIAQDDVKPFLKGFTAATRGANILIAASDAEAVAWLGSDYPYLIPDSDEATILAALEQTRSDFGSPRWLQGLDRMRGIAQRVTPSRIGRELTRLFAH